MRLIYLSMGGIAFVAALVTNDLEQALVVVGCCVAAFWCGVSAERRVEAAE